MKSIKTTVALALMLLLSTGMIACKKSEEAAVVPPAEQAAPAAPAAEPAAPAAPAPEAAAPAAPAAK